MSTLLAPVTETGPDRVSAVPDVGCDVVLFYGLTLEEESDLADGMAIVPFERIRGFVDEELVQELAPAGAEVLPPKNPSDHLTPAERQSPFLGATAPMGFGITH